MTKVLLYLGLESFVISDEICGTQFHNCGTEIELLRDLEAK